MIDQTQIEAWSNLLVSSLHSSGEFCGNGTVALVEFRAMFAPMRGGGCCALPDDTRARPMRAYRANRELPGATVQGIVPTRDAGGARGTADWRAATGWHNGIADDLTVAQIADALEEALAATSGLSPFFIDTSARKSEVVDDQIISEEEDLPQLTFDTDGELCGFRLAGLNWRSDDGYVWTAEHDGRQYNIKGSVSLESDGTLQFGSRLPLAPQMEPACASAHPSAAPQPEYVPALGYARATKHKFLTSSNSRKSRLHQYRRLRALECEVQSTQPEMQWDDAWQLLLTQCKAMLPSYQKMDHAGAY